MGIADALRDHLGFQLGGSSDTQTGGPQSGRWASKVAEESSQSDQSLGAIHAKVNAHRRDVEEYADRADARIADLEDAVRALQNTLTTFINAQNQAKATPNAQQGFDAYYAQFGVPHPADFARQRETPDAIVAREDGRALGGQAFRGLQAMRYEKPRRSLLSQAQLDAIAQQVAGPMQDNVPQGVTDTGDNLSGAISTDREGDVKDEGSRNNLYPDSPQAGHGL